MATDKPQTAARLTAAYKGIEGFYVLNRAGELGYVSSDGQRLVREEFREASPDVPSDKLESFRAALREAALSFPPSGDKELGYLLPFDAGTLWKTATIHLHEIIEKDLRDAFDRDLAAGRMTLDEGDRRVQDITAERGLHRGFEALLAHVGSFGTHTFFPVLYYRPPGESDYPLRVVNLLSLLASPGKFNDILSVLRHNLTGRGALNQSSRVEHRFKLVDED